MTNPYIALKNNKIDIGTVRNVINAYYYSTGISVLLIDKTGKNLASCGEEMTFCKYFQECTKDELECSEAHYHASKQAEAIGDCYIFFCPAGLVHFTAPLIQNSLFQGAIVAGPILMDYPDEILIDSIIKKYNLDLSSRSKITSYLRVIPVVEASRVNHLSKLLFVASISLMRDDKVLLYERKNRMEQQAEISESIHSIKEEKTEVNYPYIKEKELINRVKNGDAIGARTILNEILGHIFFTSGGNMEVIKARTLELCSILSRASVEGGGALNKIFGMNYRFIGELSKINNIEDLSFWMAKVLDRFTENVFNLADSKNVVIMKKALSYINENYMNNIKLETVANQVYLNFSYFSTLFKKETGMNFSEYLNKVRIEQSKQLLRNMKNSILDVALAVGFDDQSYYSKVFKRFTGITPRSYRDRYSG